MTRKPDRRVKDRNKYRENAIIALSCGQVEKDKINEIAKDMGYDSTANFLRKAINTFIGEELLLSRSAPNQHTNGRGKND